MVAALSLLSATAVAGEHRVVLGTKGGDEMTMGSGANRVFARAGDDVAVLGKNDVVEQTESGGDVGCEKVKGPGAPRACASHGDGCDEPARPCIATSRECGEVDAMPCASNSDACPESTEEPCVATSRGCGEPGEGQPEVSPSLAAPKPRTPGA